MSEKIKFFRGEEKKKLAFFREKEDASSHFFFGGIAQLVRAFA